MDTDSDNWLKDKINDNLIQMHRLAGEVYSGETDYQSVRIVRTPGSGTALVLDGKIQSTEREEFIYHEAIVHPAMIVHPQPESVCIVGGGEGGVLREVLRHRTVKRAVMVEIDAQVTALSRQYLPGESRGAFDDPRADVHFTDARAYLENSPDRFDVIIIDLPDPIEEGPAYRLFTKEFYQTVFQHLTDDGIITVQAGSASLTELLNLTAVMKTLQAVFPMTAAYLTNMLCYGGAWGFAFASKGLDPVNVTPADIDRRLTERGIGGLRHYDGITHRGMFSPPLYIREAVKQQTRIITDDTPLYLYGT